MQLNKYAEKNILTYLATKDLIILDAEYTCLILYPF